MYNPVRLNPYQLKEFNIHENPIVEQFAEKITAFFDKERNRIGIILKDRTDKDYNYVVLQPYEKNGPYREIDTVVSIKTQEEAEKQLLERMQTAPAPDPTDKAA